MIRRSLKPLAAAASTAALAVAALVGFTATGNAATVHGTGATVVKAAALGNNWYASAPYLMPLDNSPPDPHAGDGRHRRRRRSSWPSSWPPTAAAARRPGAAPTRSRSDTTVGGRDQRDPRPRAATSRSPSAATAAPSSARRAAAAAATAAAYQQVIDQVRPARDRLRPRGARVREHPGDRQRARRGADPAANNPGLYISVTMPGTTAGTGWFGTQLLDEAKSLGFTPNNFSIMPFDGGFSGAAAQTSALEAFHALLMTHLRLGLGDRVRARGRVDDERPHRLGRVLLPGRLPDRAELRDRATASAATPSGRSTGTASATRRTTTARSSGTCSARDAERWDFTKYAAAVRRRDAAGDHAADQPARPPAAAAPARRPPWNASTIYNGGDVVSYNGHVWAAKWWTQGEAPSTGGSGVWTDEGPC